MKAIFYICVLFSVAASTALDNELREEAEFKMEFSNPLLSIYQKGLKINLAGDQMSSKENGVFTLLNVNTKIEKELQESNLSANHAVYNELQNYIDFTRSVNLIFNTDNDKAQLKTDTLAIDLNKEIIISKDLAELYLTGFYISAKSFIYNLKTGSEYLVEFFEGEFIDKESSENYGKADSLQVLKNNIILLKGNATLTQGTINIAAESIYYDYLERSVIKSINAKVTNI